MINTEEMWNQWLLEDRLRVINIALIAPRLPFVFIEEASDRDEVLGDMLDKFPDYVPIKDYPTVEVYSSVSYNGNCAYHDEAGRLVWFAPLSVVSDEWIDWYRNTQMTHEG